MAITATTLSGAITSYVTSFGVASTTNITAPVLTTGSGYTFLKVDDELMFVTGVPVSGTVQVVRGFGGTQAVSHIASVPVIVGLPTDFVNFAPNITSFSTSLPYNFTPIGPPLTGTPIAPLNGYIHHFTGTTAIVNITVPTACVSGGMITLIFDGSASGLTWTAAGNINVAGTSTTAGSAVSFFYDPSISKWVPSRLA